MKAANRLRCALGLLASPQVIPNLDRGTVYQVVDTCLRNINQAEDVGRRGPAQLLHLVEGSGGVYFLYDARTNSVLYFVRYRVVEFPSGPSGSFSSGARQVLVWRNSDAAAAAGVARHVFWDILFPRFKTLVSDSQQTSEGKKFWLYTLQDALSRGHKVRLINTADRTERTLTSNDELLSLEDKIWGPKSWFQRIILVIS